MKSRELIFVAVVTALLGLGLVLDVLFEPQSVREPVVEAGEHLASGSYCPAPSGEGVRAVMTTTNLADSPLGLRRSAVGGTEATPEQSTLDPQRLAMINVGQFNMDNATGVVDAFGGRGYTNLTVLSSGAGIASSRCSSQPAALWMFAAGSTLRDDDHYLLVANPFREEALVSVRILGPDQDMDLPLITDEVVRAQSQRVFFMAENLEEMPSFGMQVTASRGRVVVSRYSLVDNSVTRGVSLDVGIRSAAGQWYFASGRVPTDGEESIVIINPSDREALLSGLFMTEGDRVAPPELAEVAVPAGRQVTINTSDHLPRGTGHGVSLTSLNEVQVVAERQIRGVVGPIRGFESVFGVPAAGLRWVLPVGTPEGGSASLAIINPGQEPVEVGVRLITDDAEVSPAELSAVTVGAGRKVTLDLTGYLGGGSATAVVTSDGEVVVDSTTAMEGSYNDFDSTPGVRLP